MGKGQGLPEGHGQSIDLNKIINELLKKTTSEYATDNEEYFN